MFTTSQIQQIAKKYGCDAVVCRGRDLHDDTEAPWLAEFQLSEQERQVAEIERDNEWLPLLDAVTHPENVEGWDIADLTAGEQTALAYGGYNLTAEQWNPLAHIPADPTVMYQKGWVCNSKRAAIKAAYEKQSAEQYRAMFK